MDRGAWQQRLYDGQVLDEHGQPVRADNAYRGGGRLYYWRALDDEPEIPFEATVRFQDAHLLVVDKPHFLPVTPTGRFVRQSLLVRLKQATGIDTLSPIHRIDRETADWWCSACARRTAVPTRRCSASARWTRSTKRWRR